MSVSKYRLDRPAAKWAMRPHFLRRYLFKYHSLPAAIKPNLHKFYFSPTNPHPLLQPPFGARILIPFPTTGSGGGIPNYRRARKTACFQRSAAICFVVFSNK